MSTWIILRRRKKEKFGRIVIMPWPMIRRSVARQKALRNPPSASAPCTATPGGPDDFGPYITVAARGKRGGAAVLQNGVFVDGDPGVFDPGAIVDINMQDGLVRA